MNRAIESIISHHIHDIKDCIDDTVSALKTTDLSAYCSCGESITGGAWPDITGFLYQHDAMGHTVKLDFSLRYRIESIPD